MQACDAVEGNAILDTLSHSGEDRHLVTYVDFPRHGEDSGELAA